MMIPKHSKHFYIIAIMTFLVSANHAAATEFRPEQISCTDISSAKDRDKVEEDIHNPDGDLYMVAHAKEMLEREKTTADGGNPRGMDLYGGVLKDLLILNNLDDEKGKRKYGIMPDEIKEQMIEALTYKYIAESLVESYKNRRFNNTQYLEREHSDMKIPPEWFAEAKANAARWKEYCGK